MRNLTKIQMSALALRTISLVVLGGSLAILIPAGFAAETVPSLFPADTRGFLAVESIDELRRHFEQTQIGQLVKDPTLRPFVEDLRRQILDRISGGQEQLGVSIEQVAEMATGEVGVGVVYPDQGERPAIAAVITVTGRREKAEEVLKNLGEDVKKRGGLLEEIKAQGLTIRRLKLPDKADGIKGPELLYSLDDEFLILASRQETIEAVIGLRKKKGPSLAEVEAFSQIMERCRRDLPEGEKPQIRWFIEPFGYAEAMRAAAPAERRRQNRQLIERLKAAGFGSLKGVGGFVSFSAEGFELIHRTFVYAPPPREKSAKMFDFPNGDLFQLPAFIPRDLATVGMGYCNILTGFDNIGPVFDQTIGEGEEGVWADVLASLKEDPNGPQIDLRNEFFVHFGEKVAMLTAYRLPITTTSERMLIALEVKNPEGAMKGLEKMFQNEPRFRKREHKGKVIWEGIPEDKEKKAVPRIELGGVPGVGESSRPETSETEPLFPNASLTVHQGYLLIASHYDYLTEILELESDRETIARNPDFMEVMETIDKLGGKQACWRAFSLTDEEYRPTYELIRQGKMPESETMLGRILNTILAPPEKGAVRKQRIDGSKLPEYEVVRRHLGPAGLFVITEDDGWFIKGFTLTKK